MAKTPKTTKGAAAAQPTITAADMGFRLVRPSEPIVIGLDTKDGPEHPLYDPRIHAALKEDTIKSMMEDGVLSNVITTDALVTVDGRRRVMHAREAERRLQTTEWVDHHGQVHAADPNAMLWVPVRMRQGDDAQLFHLMVIGNTQREVEGPVAEARKAAIMQDRFKATDEQVCQAFGWGIGTLRNRRKLLKLDPKLLRDVEAGKLTWLQALKIDKLPDDIKDSAKEEVEGANEEGGHAGARRARAATTKTDDDDGALQWGKRFIKSILECDKAGDLAEDAAKMLRVILGEDTEMGPAITPLGVKGLTACIKAVDEAKRAAQAKKNEAARKRIKAAAEAKVAAGKAKKAATNKPTAAELKKAEGKPGKGKGKTAKAEPAQASA
jgi:hypothetical protein